MEIKFSMLPLTPLNVKEILPYSEMQHAKARETREEDTKLKTEMPRKILGRKSPRSVLKSRTWTSITDLGS
jgi:hypothetical protein